MLWSRTIDASNARDSQHKEWDECGTKAIRQDS